MEVAAKKHSTRDYAKLRKEVIERHAAMKMERASWDSHWTDIASAFLPRSSRFSTSHRNNGGRRHQSIIDATGTGALSTLVSGLSTLVTNPSRPWFGLRSPDSMLAADHEVREWIDEVEIRMREAIWRSNFYRSMPMAYQELAAFGTAAVFCRPVDDGRLLHFYPLTVGEYCLGQSDFNVVDSLYREFSMTVGQVVQMFGIEACSMETQRLFKMNQTDSWVTVLHAIEPRRDRDMDKQDNLNMPWRSVYLESSAAGDSVLEDTGFNEFPVLAPRWATVSGDIYGQSPGMLALGAVEQLQHQQWRKGQAIDYQTQPPKYAPASMEGREVSMLPGSTTFGGNPGDEIRQAFTADLRIDHLAADMNEVRGRIEKSFFANLILMFTGTNLPQMTAAETAARESEKSMLGPALENLQEELLRPVINMFFSRMAQMNMLPPAPEQLQGVDLTVEFTSILSLAQKAIGVNQVRAFMGDVASVGQFRSEAWDRVDVDDLIDGLASMHGVPAKMLVPIEEAAQLRVARNNAMAAKEQAAMANANSQTVQRFSRSPVGGAEPNVLDALSQGGGQPQGQ